MRVYTCERFKIYVHKLDHPPPHCHVRFKDESEICVTIPLIEPMYGACLPQEVKKVIVDNIDKISDTWDKLHPKRVNKISLKVKKK